MGLLICNVAQQFTEETKLKLQPKRKEWNVCCNLNKEAKNTEAKHPEPRGKPKLIDATFSPFLSIIGQKVAK